MISDFDGTITKTDFRGFFSAFFFNWYHKNVIQLLKKIEDKKIIVFFLTMRSIELVYL